MSGSESSSVVMLDVDKILVPQERVTSVLDDELLSELEASIKEKGILQPLLIGRVGDKYVLIDGLHRLIIAKKLGMRAVPCIVKEMSEEELVITNLIVNRQRGKSNPADEARIIKMLIDDYKYNLSAVAEKLNMSISTVEKYYQIGKQGVSELLEALKLGKISVGCAYYISMIEDREKQREVVEYAVKWGYTVEQCKAAVLPLTLPSYTPKEGGWAIQPETGEPVRLKMRTAFCNMDEDPQLVVSIPVPVKYADAIRALLSDSEICKTIVEAVGEEAGAELPSAEKAEPEKAEKKIEKIMWEW